METFLLQKLLLFIQGVPSSIEISQVSVDKQLNGSFAKLIFHDKFDHRRTAEQWTSLVWANL